MMCRNLPSDQQIGIWGHVGLGRILEIRTLNPILEPKPEKPKPEKSEHQFGFQPMIFEIITGSLGFKPGTRKT
jgi:hypothetical protein